MSRGALPATGLRWAVAISGTAAPNALARAERAALCDLLTEVGPDAPTLCEGWTTRDLAAHLVIRETRPDAGLGIVLAPFASYTAKVLKDAAARPWPDLVSAVRQGPPRWAPQSIARLDAEMNTVEYFVHHEDVRRGTAPWTPRDLDTATTAELWSRVTKTARFFTRRCKVGILARPTDGPSAGTSRRLRSGAREVTLVGPASEILLALLGRTTLGLEIEGEAADIEQFTSFAR